MTLCKSCRILPPGSPPRRPARLWSSTTTPPAAGTDIPTTGKADQPHRGREILSFPFTRSSHPLAEMHQRVDEVPTVRPKSGEPSPLSVVSPGRAQTPADDGKCRLIETVVHGRARRLGSGVRLQRSGAPCPIVSHAWPTKLPKGLSLWGGLQGSPSSGHYAFGPIREGQSDPTVRPWSARKVPGCW